MSGASFARALSRLILAVQTKANLGVSPGVAPPTVMSIIPTLFTLPGLRALSIVYYSFNATLHMDTDMLAVAMAWKNLEDLSFDFPFSKMYELGSFLGLPALAHFAAHCPRFARLRIPLALLPSPPELPGTESQTAHSQNSEGRAPGERLLVQLPSEPTSAVDAQAPGSGVEPEAVAQRIDELFPNLGRDELQFRYPIWPRMPARRYQLWWDRMVTTWKESRAEREGDVHGA